MNAFDRTIDRAPEIPYFILAFAYMLANPDPRQIVHVFSVCFIYLALAIGAGMALKLTLKTRRPRPHYRIAAIDYGFPSLHSMISVGAIALIWFFQPLYAMILAPIGVVYMLSRYHMRVHKGVSVVGGAILGVGVGWATGQYILPVYLDVGVETVFAFLFFALPVLVTPIRHSLMVDQ